MNCLPFLVKRSSALILAGALAAASAAQTSSSLPSLTLAQALEMAKDRNGTVKSAEYLVNAARQRVAEAFSAFLPSITPEYTYNSLREQFQLGTATAFLQQEGGSTSVNTSMTLLDSGQRQFTLSASRRSLSSQKFSAKQTLRTTLFSVTQQFYETLRSQELLNVSQSQVDRTAQILSQTKARIIVKDAAAIEELQANADYQNARVQLLVSRNSVSSNAASLKGLIGLDSDQPLPTLEKTDVEARPISKPQPMLVRQGLAERPDLQSMRQSLQAARYNYLVADRNANLGLSVTLNYDQQITPISLQDRALLLTLSYPLFDGGLTRAQARELRDDYASDKALLVQAERSAQAEIEAAYATDSQDLERLDAAKTALDAAQKNYDAALESQKLGAYDLIQVLTANVSLVTAQSDYIQAIYDFAISDVNLKLVTGQPIPWE
jgi:outer membrane protein